ncbi:uncharacterized protein BXZ73DRAFT_99052 [Epithele typhae]|uniref:uncharacterized protein n=1 Tax=Epithele typhae TaxID=378194 RepID=UPI00200854CF|nr:uncharacterized protein BXZ73DRAFT_99052 [Epithele typhae]KAH9940055.1 hypothetical protein BXZ73DRAFT_99052 [Epithele typhae]
MAIDPSRQSPRVPPEISDEIIKHLDPTVDRKTLLQCALVSHTWQAASKYVLSAEPGFLTLENAYIFVARFCSTLDPTLPPSLFANLRTVALRRLMMVVDDLSLEAAYFLDQPSISNLPRVTRLTILATKGTTANLLAVARRLVQGSSPRLHDIEFYWDAEALTSASPAALGELGELTSCAPFSAMKTATFFLDMERSWDGEDDYHIAVKAACACVVEMLTGALPDFVRKTQVEVDMYGNSHARVRMPVVSPIPPPPAPSP